MSHGPPKVFINPHDVIPEELTVHMLQKSELLRRHT